MIFFSRDASHAGRNLTLTSTVGVKPRASLSTGVPAEPRGRGKRGHRHRPLPTAAATDGGDLRPPKHTAVGTYMRMAFTCPLKRERWSEWLRSKTQLCGVRDAPAKRDTERHGSQTGPEIHPQVETEGHFLPSSRQTTQPDLSPEALREVWGGREGGLIMPKKKTSPKTWFPKTKMLRDKCHKATVSFEFGQSGTSFSLFSKRQELSPALSWGVGGARAASQEGGASGVDWGLVPREVIVVLGPVCPQVSHVPAAHSALASLP